MNAKPITEAAPNNVVQLNPESAARRAKPRETEVRFKLKEFENASGTLSWRVDGYRRDGSRVRDNFSDKLKAKSRQLELETEWLKGEAKTEMQATKLSADLIRLAESAFLRLGPGRELELPLAIEHWLTHGRQHAEIESPELDEAFTQFSAWLEKSTLRELTRRNLKTRVNAFVNSMPNLRVADVKPEHVDTYLAGRNASPKTKDNDRRAISRFFSWCMGYQDGERASRRWAASNPCRREKQKRQHDGSQPAILTLEQCKALLKAAEAHKGGLLAPYVAVSLFGGLRPYEAQRLQWGAVNLTDKEIRMEGTTTKTGAPRIVAIDKTLLAWLKAYKDKPFCPPNWRKHLDAIKAQAGLVRRESAKSKGTYQKLKNGKLVSARRYWSRVVAVAWAPDILRHTAASHYFRQTGSYGRTAEQFGNSEAIIKRHYQGMVSSEETKSFYSLLPKKGGRK